MWHEARKHEKATQKLINNHKRRAEKRREDDKVDPNSLLQINGIKSRLNIDPNIYKQAVKSLVIWQGDKNVTIDRFDVRALLTSIPTESSTKSSSNQRQPIPSSRNSTVLDINESEPMKRMLNYERYRLLIQNDLEGDNLDIDNVNISHRSDSRRVDKVAQRYGLSSEEFTLLAQWEGQDTDNGQIIRELNLLKERVKKKEEVTTEIAGGDVSTAPPQKGQQKNQVYGPDLPPEQSEHLEQPGQNEQPEQIEQLERREQPEPLSPLSTSNPKQSPPSIVVARRASTPLAYKRTERSSRSLSRDRRSRYRSSRRRRSSSSMSSLTRSSRSSPSSSDSSYRRRRRRRRRSRSPPKRRRYR